MFTSDIKLNPNTDTLTHMGSDFGIGFVTMQSGFLLIPFILFILSDELPWLYTCVFSIMTLGALAAAIVYKLFWNDSLGDDTPVS